MAKFEGIYSKELREEKITDEYERLALLLPDESNVKISTLEKLLYEIAFMTVTLEETRKIIVRDGIIEEYQNGANQSGLKKSPAVEVYDKMFTSYSRTIEQINKLLPEGNGVDPSKEVKDFINKK